MIQNCIVPFYFLACKFITLFRFELTVCLPLCACVPLRGRVDRKRVHALVLSQQEKKAKQEAEERAAVTDWKAEVERQAAEWRAEFLKKKEDAELEKVVALQQTIEHLIVQTMIANNELPDRSLPLKQKSAYQIEWEKLQSEDKQSSGDNSDSDDIVLPDSERSAEEELAGKKSDDKESREVADAAVENVFTGAFEVIDQKEQVRQSENMAAEENAHRHETKAVLSDMLNSIINDHESGKDRQATKKKPEEIINALMEDMIAQLERMSLMAFSVLRDEENGTSAGADAPETKLEDTKTELEAKTKEAANFSEQTAEEEEDTSNMFRASLPQVEVDAVSGFFEDQYAAIRTLRAEKSRLKSIIAKYKKKFEKKYGHIPGWNERTKEIKAIYEDYQEVRASLVAGLIWVVVNISQ